MGKAKTKVTLEATVTRADGTVEDLGIISREEVDKLPEWFRDLQKTEAFKAQEGVIENS